MPIRSTRFFWALTGLLTCLTLGLYLLGDIPRVLRSETVHPFQINHNLITPDETAWYGVDIPYTAEQLEILSPSTPTLREYRNTQGEIVWLTLLQSASMSGLHNLYDSLLASGAEPSIEGPYQINTPSGPLKTTRIRLQNPGQQPYLALLWYQWEAGHAENRWQWYWHVLKSQFQNKTLNWQLVEVATPMGDSPDKALKRLEHFAILIYEQAQKRTDQQSQDAHNT